MTDYGDKQCLAEQYCLAGSWRAARKSVPASRVLSQFDEDEDILHISKTLVSTAGASISVAAHVLDPCAKQLFVIKEGDLALKGY